MSGKYPGITFSFCPGVSPPSGLSCLNLQNNTVRFLPMSYFLPSPLSPSTSTLWAFVLKWQFIPSICTATFNIHFLTEQRTHYDPMEEIKISAIYCSAGTISAPTLLIRALVFKQQGTQPCQTAGFLSPFILTAKQ